MRPSLICVAAVVAIGLFPSATIRAATVFVETSPPISGAQVVVDGRVVDMTANEGTAYLEGVPSGSHQFGVRLPDGRVVETTGFVNEGPLSSRVLVRIPRRTPPPRPPTTTEVYVAGNVGRAKVEVDGKPAGHTGGSDGSLVLRLTEGRHRIRLSAEGYIAEDKMVNVVPGPWMRMRFELRPRPGGSDSGDGIRPILWYLILLLTLTVGAAAVVAFQVLRSVQTRRVTTRRVERYETREVIGRGGMATVYKARDMTRPRSRPVALKVLDEGFLHDTGLVRKFLREGEVLMLLVRSDPEAPLVHVYHYGRSPGNRGVPFIAMELLEGEDLFHLVKRKGRLEPREAVHIITGVARALEPAHAIGVYHRDLTPDNVILVSEPRGGYRLRLIDFGVARHEYTAHGTLDGSIAGKPPYMSPEQCRGVPVNGRSDIYSLGIMLYTMVHGSPPFTHRNPLEVMRMHQDEPVRFSTDCPRPLVLFLQRVLAKDPAGRYSSVTQLRAVLKRLQDSL